MDRNMELKLLDMEVRTVLGNDARRTPIHDVRARELYGFTGVPAVSSAEPRLPQSIAHAIATAPTLSSKIRAPSDSRSRATYIMTHDRADHRPPPHTLSSLYGFSCC